MTDRAPAHGDGGDRWQRIMIAAYDLLDEEGLDGLTIRAVLKRTGLSRRAVYDRFGTKDDLVIAVFEHTIRLAVERFAVRLADIPDPLERLRFIVTGFVLGRSVLEAGGSSRSRVGTAMSREHLRLAESHPAALQQALAPLIGQIARQLEEAMRAGRVRSTSPDRLAMLIYNLVATTVHKELLADPAGVRSEDRTQLAAELWEFCARAIAA